MHPLALFHRPPIAHFENHIFGAMVLSNFLQPGRLLTIKAILQTPFEHNQTLHIFIHYLNLCNNILGIIAVELFIPELSTDLIAL